METVFTFLAPQFLIGYKTHIQKDFVTIEQQKPNEESLDVNTLSKWEVTKSVLLSHNFYFRKTNQNPFHYSVQRETHLVNGDSEKYWNVEEIHRWYQPSLRLKKYRLSCKHFCWMVPNERLQTSICPENDFLEMGCRL